MSVASFRIGEGWDTHQLVTGRPLILGGITIPHTHGLLGHSDADALAHAITDALLGAAALGDIGKHFPDTDVRYQGISSMELLAEVLGKMKDKGYKIENADLTIIAEKPKIAPYVDAMKAKLAAALEIETDRISIKATTMEGIGLIGREEGMACQASVLMSFNNDERN